MAPPFEQGLAELEQIARWFRPEAKMLFARRLAIEIDQVITTHREHAGKYPCIEVGSSPGTVFIPSGTPAVVPLVFRPDKARNVPRMPAQRQLWLMGALQTVHVGTCLDTGHAALSGDLHNVMYKLSGHLQLVHANDNLGKYDDHLPPGHGKVNWRRLLTELSNTGFKGGFILELAGNREPQVIMNEARHARRHLRDISKDISINVPPTAGGSQPFEEG